MYYQRDVKVVMEKCNMACVRKLRLKKWENGTELKC